MFYTHISGANSRKLVRVVRKRKPELCTIRVLSRLHPNSKTIRGWDFCFEVVVSFERIWKQNRFVSDRPLSLPISNTIALRATLPCRFNLVIYYKQSKCSKLVISENVTYLRKTVHGPKRVPQVTLLTFVYPNNV